MIPTATEQALSDAIVKNLSLKTVVNLYVSETEGLIHAMCVEVPSSTGPVK